MSIKTDFLVIGSGLAGLSIALKAAAFEKVTIVTKAGINDSNTLYAQGGIAAVNTDEDDFERHIKDTLTAGAGICNENVVRKVVTQAPIKINQLIEWVANFDKNISGGFDLAKEGGHSDHRILHHKDNTGFEIQRVLSENIKKREHCVS